MVQDDAERLLRERHVPQLLGRPGQPRPKGQIDVRSAVIIDGLHRISHFCQNILPIYCISTFAKFYGPTFYLNQPVL